MEETLRKIGSAEMRSALGVLGEAMRVVHGRMYSEGVVQLMPIMISPITDPLNHSVFDASIDYCGTKLELTKSMILHKQLALAGGLDAIYIVSPNVRLEKPEKGESGRHLLEFVQVDYEMKGRSMEQVMRFSEELLAEIVEAVRTRRGQELGALGRELRAVELPLKVFDSHELEREYGADWETAVSEASRMPVWVTNHEREFYDREDPARPFTYRNYDIIYPEGFGEGLSGAEREWEYGRILERMERKGMDLGPYAAYLEVARKGLLVPSAGAGIGVERLVRYCCGLKHIADARPFAKVPGRPLVF
ncbi:MAG: asparagine synthetase A [Candidatus Burarchaeum sp.]|nr:asparagine synthetase A [Candidatus Burarchaeum sp.]MDO8339251.1 asparagine synthetase A [Candidatus Burarchaeum sp.]